MKKVRITLATAAFALAFAGVFASVKATTVSKPAQFLNSSSVCTSDTVIDACTLTVATNNIRCTTITNSQPAFKVIEEGTPCTVALYRPQ